MATRSHWSSFAAALCLLLAASGAATAGVTTEALAYTLFVPEELGAVSWKLDLQGERETADRIVLP